MIFSEDPNPEDQNVLKANLVTWLKKFSKDNGSQVLSLADAYTGDLKFRIDRFTSLQYTKWIDKIIYIQSDLCIFSKFTSTFTTLFT